MNGLESVSVCEGSEENLDFSRRNSSLSRICLRFADMINWLVTLTKACQQTNTPNTHTHTLFLSSATYIIVSFGMHGIIPELSLEFGFET